MKKTNEDLKWHVIYEGSGSITGNSWIEEVAYLGNEQWLLRIYDDPAWSFDPDEPMLPEKKTSDELVTFVASIDAVGGEDALPRQKSLYDAAIRSGAIQCIELLKESISSRVEESLILALGPPRTIGKKNSSISIKTQKKAGEAMHTTGKVIREGGEFKIMEASPDHPIYKRGFVIGGRTLKPSSSATPATNSSKERKKPDTKQTSPEKSNIPRVPKTMAEHDRELQEWMDSGIYEAARHQMGAGTPFETTEPPALSTGGTPTDSND